MNTKKYTLNQTTNKAGSQTNRHRVWHRLIGCLSMLSSKGSAFKIFFSGSTDLKYKNHVFAGERGSHKASIYAFCLCGILWLILSCKDSKPKTVVPPTGSTTATTGSTTGSVPPPPTPKEHAWTGLLEIHNLKKYHSLLRGQKRCDYCSNAKGNLSCNRFKNVATIKVTFEKEELPADVTLTITPVRGQSWWGSFYFGACSWHHPNPTAPLLYKGKAKYINDYGGFYVRFHKSADAFGQVGLGYIILKSEYSLPEDRSTLDVTVYYGVSDRDNNEMGTVDLQHPADAEPNYTSR